MKRKSTYFKIGVFVLASIAVLVSGIIVISAGVLTQETFLVETYFDESVQGLGEGSPLLQRGVQIGSVKEITFVPRVYGDALDLQERLRYGRYVMVVMEINQKHFRGGMAENEVAEHIRRLVQNGLRVRLSPQGITGIFYVEADFVEPARYPPMELAWDPEHIYIPSMPSLLASFSESMDAIFQTLERVDFEKIANTFNEAMTSITTLAEEMQMPVVREEVLDLLQTIRRNVEEAQVAQVRRELVGLLEQLRTAVEEARIGEVREELVRTVRGIQETNERISAFIGPAPADDESRSLQDLLGRVSRVMAQVDRILLSQEGDVDDIVDNLRRASEDLSDLAERLNAYPRQLLFGGPPEPAEVLE